MRLCAIALVLLGVACSKPTRTTAERRSAFRIESAGVVAEVTITRDNVEWSRGFREAGRWFSWEAPKTECNVHAALVATGPGEAALRHGWAVETAPAKLLYMDEAACKERYASVQASGCAKDGVVIVDVDGERRGLATIDQRLFTVDLQGDEGPCEGVLAAQPRPAVLAALSRTAGMCTRLLATDDLEAATLCFIDYNTRAGSAVTKEGLLQLVEQAKHGETVADERAPWLAALTKGGALEEAFYALLLAEPAFAKRFDTGENAGIALAFTPSRSRRMAYLHEAIARCHAKTFAPWQATLAGVAAGAVGKAVGKSVKDVCDVEIVAPDAWFGSHLH